MDREVPRHLESYESQLPGYELPGEGTLASDSQRLLASILELEEGFEAFEKGIAQEFSEKQHLADLKH